MASVEDLAAETVSETALGVGVPVPEVSSHIDEAAELRRQAVELRQMLDEMEARSGPIPPEVRARVRTLPWPN